MSDLIVTSFHREKKEQIFQKKLKKEEAQTTEIFPSLRITLFLFLLEDIYIFQIVLKLSGSCLFLRKYAESMQTFFQRSRLILSTIKYKTIYNYVFLSSCDE